MEGGASKLEGGLKYRNAIYIVPAVVRTYANIPDFVLYVYS
jgi:hypothetical protein